MSLSKEPDRVAVSSQDPRAIRRAPLFARSGIADRGIDRHINELVEIGQSFGTRADRNISRDHDIARFAAAVLADMGKRSRLVVCGRLNRFNRKGHHD